jgi:hypothetical protein
MNWQEFENEIIRLVDALDEASVPMKPYAQTYARNIMANLEEGRYYGMSDEDATKTQMLYVLSNLEGATEADLRQIEMFAVAHGVDVSESVKELLEGEQDPFASELTEGE